VTDRTGIVLQDVQREGRMPSHESFPLKVHYCVLQDQSAAKDSARPRGFVDISLKNILPGIVHSQFRRMGLDNDDDFISKHGVLTDLTGVNVPVFGPLPDCSRFPLKLYFDTSAFEDLQAEGLKNNRNRVDSTASAQIIRSGLEQKARNFKRSTSSLAASVLKIATPQRCRDFVGTRSLT